MASSSAGPSAPTYSSAGPSSSIVPFAGLEPSGAVEPLGVAPSASEGQRDVPNATGSLACPALSAGHWRWGADAAPFTLPSSQHCAYYGYHRDCCTHEQNCEEGSFQGQYVLNDGSAFFGVPELDALLSGGKRMLVAGDSQSFYLGHALACLAGPSASAGDPHVMPEIAYTLPSGGVVTLRLAQRCDILIGKPSLAAFYAGFDFIVANYGAWYRADEAAITACMAEVMPVLAAIHKQPGKAVLFTSNWPSHFYTTDGVFTEDSLRTCVVEKADPRACLSFSTVEELGRSGFGASARARGPTGYVGGCAPPPNDVSQGMNVIIQASSSAHGIPFADLSPILGPLYSAHLGKYKRLDCAHYCFSPAIFAPVWDLLVRTLHFGAALPHDQRTPVSSAYAPALGLDLEACCPRRDQLVSLFGELQTRSCTSPLLRVNVDGSGLHSLLEALTPCNGTSAAAVDILVSLSSGDEHARGGHTVLVFLDVYYGDAAVMWPSSNGSTTGGPRHHYERVFLSQSATQAGFASNDDDPVQTVVATVPVDRHTSWVRRGVAAGDVYELRVVACARSFSNTTARRDGGRPLCAMGGALGYAVLPLRFDVGASTCETIEG